MRSDLLAVALMVAARPAAPSRPGSSWSSPFPPASDPDTADRIRGILTKSGPASRTSSTDNGETRRFNRHSMTQDESPPALRDALAKGDYPPQGEHRPLASMPAAGPDRMIVGKTSQGSLFGTIPFFWNDYRDYTPRKDLVDKIARRPGVPFDILVFSAPGARASVSEVPKVLRHSMRAGNKNLSFALLPAVDRPQP